MKQDLIDKVSYKLYLSDSHNYFSDSVVPSVVKQIFLLVKEEISPDAITRCQVHINQFEKQIQKGGYNISINEVLKYYPIFVSDKLDLLGEYIANSPFCQFLESGLTPAELIIKLDGNSSNPDVNTFSSLLKESYRFKNIILVYNYKPDTKINFLSLAYIIDNDSNRTIKPDEPDWLEYVQLGYFELFMIITFHHALWHLLVAHITCVAKETIKDKELVKVFEMSEQNIFNKANDVKTFFFQTPILFNTILYGNPLFMEYSAKWINGFIDSFDIQTHYEKYFLRGLNPVQEWVPGFKENLQVVKNFASDIIKKTNPNTSLITDIWSWNCYQNINPIDRQIPIQKLIEILYTIGSVYHSNTFEYGKLGFTELIYRPGLPGNIYQILLSTLDWNVDFPVFGDYKYYSSTHYANCFENLQSNLLEVRNQITQRVDSNLIYKPYIYTREATEHFSINTWNTRV